MIRPKHFLPSVLRLPHDLTGRNFHPTDVAATAGGHARRWPSSLLLALSMVGSAAFADTDDRIGAAPASTLMATEPGAVSAPVAGSLNMTAAGSEVAAYTVRLQGAPAAAADPLPRSGFGKPLDAEGLDGQRGGAEVAATPPLSAIFANGTVADNRAVDVVTGSNSIRDGAFSNASGLPIVIQNTGANVLIQSATIVNVQLR